MPTTSRKLTKSEYSIVIDKIMISSLDLEVTGFDSKIALLCICILYVYVCKFVLHIIAAYSLLFYREGKKEKILTNFSRLPPQL